MSKKKSKSHNERTGQDMAALGALGGKASTNQAAIAALGGRAVWASLTAKQRSERNRERARKAWVTRRKNAAKKGRAKA